MRVKIINRPKPGTTIGEWIVPPGTVHVWIDAETRRVLHADVRDPEHAAVRDLERIRRELTSRP